MVIATVLMGAWQFFSGCSREEKPAALLAEPLSSPAGDASPTLFQKIPATDSGIHFSNPIVPDHPLRFLFAKERACGGIAVGDIDGDGKEDIFCTGGPVPNALYRQTAPFQFEEITAAAGVGGDGAWSSGAAMVDIENDGDLDIYVANYDSPNHLFLNRGDGTFEEAAEAAGLALSGASLMPAFSDYDRDGDLDCYLLTNRFQPPNGQPETDDVVRTELVGDTLNVSFTDPELARYFKINEHRQDGGSVAFSLMKVGQPDVLLRNDGTGKFTDVTAASGIAGTGFGLSATWWDIDGDGFQDLWVGNDFDDPDRVYRNMGDGTFRDIVRSIAPHVTWFSMGADAADLNGDGLTDFVIADMAGSNHFKQKTSMGAMGAKADFLRDSDPQQYMRNAVFINTGTARLQEAAYLTGLSSTDWTWSVLLSDFDNDSKTDAYFTNGMTRNFNDSDSEAAIIRPNENEWERHVRAGTDELREENRAFRNQGDLSFEDTGQAWGLDHTGMSFAAAKADLDGDGNLDLIVANVNEPVSIYRNTGVAENRRATVSLRGTASNRFGVGARVTVTTADATLVQDVSPWRGYMASNSPDLHFGLGTATRIDRLSIRWPSGIEQEFDALAVDQHFTVFEPAASEARPAPPKRPPFQFTYSQTLAQAHPVENAYDDFARQPLLPNQLSKLGPGMAWGDLDGDGDDDLWSGGPAGTPGSVLRNDGNTTFTPFAQPALTADSASEDMGAVWIDFDSDGDLDLYVASGGYEFDPGDPNLRDRLYINPGNGVLTRSPDGVIPDIRTSSGTVSACDFDRDGDLDLFVGGRVVPGDYPTAAKSHLLRNDGGHFVSATQEIAPGLESPGLVTSSLWSDTDGDGWIDLLLTLEWGPVMVFRNEGGKRLSDFTEPSGTGGLSGWWNGITGRDLDGDGDTDYVVTNFGLNTKYHASKDAPALLYYGEFEGDGRRHIVEAEFEDETLFPVRGKSCSSSAMPHLKKEFTSYAQFALADLTSIYQPAKLDEAQRFAATTLESGVLRNDGTGRFTFTSLPRLAQIAPSFGCELTEFDGDGIADLFLAQNFYSPQVETGHMDGGVSLLLSGTGDGGFRPVAPSESGLVIAGDASGATLPDLDSDGAPDLAVGLNDAPMMAFIRRAERAGKTVSIRLQGPSGNTGAAGARVAFILDDGSTQTAEVYAGGGYLSQGPPELAFGIPEGRSAKAVSVRWPDGKVATFPAPGSPRTTLRAEIPE